MQFWENTRDVQTKQEDLTDPPKHIRDLIQFMDDT